ncbi:MULTISPECIES: TIGR02530 family flagellar biosynthesis protein [Lysinibacillus]|uniref:Flagellar protein n=1 Tax=Lysinibacillus antri TaxID=2498145 RepID=A0A3S0RL36_9BACI|nr:MULTISPECIES: TIGR02530 family flagellar biosynthesis protein [Lysinibacillus]RUL55801.1 flagellar protein [Lysinibacillus antri]TSI11404.1 flagellar protein [Lysinibacillus sp. BW-2-10]
MHRIGIGHVPLQPTSIQSQLNNRPIQTKQSFIAHLQQATENQELKISKHANERILERNISISDQEWQIVTDKVFEARSKGVNQPLVLMDQAALIVSAKNATVITAMERTEAKEQIFTNIDGTIVL